MALSKKKNPEFFNCLFVLIAFQHIQFPCSIILAQLPFHYCWIFYILWNFDGCLLCLKVLRIDFCQNIRKTMYFLLICVCSSSELYYSNNFYLIMQDFISRQSYYFQILYLSPSVAYFVHVKFILLLYQIDHSEYY